MLAPPPLEFAGRDGKHLAFQSAGGGPPDLVFVAGSMAISLAWEQARGGPGPAAHGQLRALVTYDQQGMGYSDRMDLSAPPTIYDLVDDLEAVIDGGRRAVTPSSSGHTTAAP